MSKAFTREDENPESAAEGEEEVSLPAQASGKNYMTPLGASKLRQELKNLLDVERPQLVKTVSWAASNGDRSENGDYLYGKKKLREIDKRIRFITKRLESLVEVDPAKQKSDRVLFGASVKIEDEDGKVRNYRIVGIDEADVAAGKVSWISPIARALLQNKVGDIVSLKTPKGEEDLEILEIKYVAIT